MGGEQRGDDARRTFGIEAGESRGACEFGVAVEAVAGFGFDGGGAGAEHPVAMAAGGGEQLVFAGGAGEGDCAQNASAGCGDLLIGGAGDALFEFGGAIAGEDEMGVGVDEAGGDAAALGVDDGGVWRNLRTEFGVWAGGDDAAAFNEQRGVFGDDAEFAEFGADARARAGRRG